MSTTYENINPENPRAPCTYTNQVQQDANTKKYINATPILHNSDPAPHDSGADEVPQLIG